MRQFLKKLILPFLHIIRRLISILLNHAIPLSPPPIDPPKAFQYFYEDELREGYKHFKKYFYDAIFLEINKLREYAINKAVLNHKANYYYLEFGVLNGGTLNLFSKVLKDTKIYGFDSFEGLIEDWKGMTMSKGHFNLKKKLPRLNDNCVLVKGWIQDTLPKFISEKKDLKINFVHIDTDTYPTAKFILQKIKPYLVDDSIILFDELYNNPGWRVGEYKALTEVFDEKEYQFIGFSIDSTNVAIQYKKNVSSS